MYLLALETATAVCSVAVFRNDKLLVELSLYLPRAHAEYLIPLVRNALSYAGIERGDLGAVAVSAGPGSYTGLRIGVSAAKGLALACGAALVAVPTLEALAASILPHALLGEILAPLLPARRDELYAALFRVEPENYLVQIAPMEVLQFERLDGWLSRDQFPSVRYIGTDLSEVRDRLGDSVAASFSDERELLSARFVGQQALARLARGEVEELSSFEPLYLKSFVTSHRQSTPFEKLSS